MGKLTQNKKIITLPICFVACIAVLFPGVAQALSQDVIKSIHKDTVWYDPEGGAPGSSTCTPSAATGNAVSGSVYIVGDSLTVGMRSSGQLQQKLINAGYASSVVQATQSDSVGDALTKVETDTTRISSASTIVVALGTNDGYTTSEQAFSAEINRMIAAIKAGNPSARIFWINAYRDNAPGAYNGINSAIQSRSGPLGFTVINWNSEASTNTSRYAPFGDANLRVHPANYGAMADFVVGQLKGTSNTAPATCVCTPTGSTPLSGSTNEEKVWNFFRGDKSLSAPAAAAMMGVLWGENSLFDPRVNYGGERSDLPLSPGRAWGIAQWLDSNPPTPGRQTALVNRARSQGVQPADLGFQLEGGVWYELQLSYYAPSLNALKGLNDSTGIPAVVETIVRNFEAPSEPEIQRSLPGRISHAQQFLLRYGSGVNSGGAGGACPIGGGGVGTSPSGFVFPLQTTQTKIKEGVNGQRWCWQSQTGCHHDYPQAADLIIETGTPVLAVRSGTIQNIGASPARFVLLADNNRTYYYTHLGAGTLRVTEGQRVTAGAVLGAVGTDADGEGISHLHIDELPRPPYSSRPGCSDSACAVYPWIDIQPELLSAFSRLPV